MPSSALLSPRAVCLRSRASIASGHAHSVSGLGALGHFGVAVAKVLGLRLVGIDVKADALELARGLKFAPDLVIDAKKPSSDAVRAIKDKFGEGVTGVDAAIIATDAIPSYQFGTDILRKHGTLIVVGQPSDPIPVKFVDLILCGPCRPRHELTIGQQGHHRQGLAARRVQAGRGARQAHGRARHRCVAAA